MGKIHPADYRNFRKKKHWFGIHHHTKRVRKGYTSTMKDDIEMSIFINYGHIKVRYLMMQKARYQTWEWYTNN